MIKKQSGYTIIEVILFLAISGSLMMLAFTFMSRSINNARFTDTAKSLEALIEQAYSSVQTNSVSKLLSKSGVTPLCSTTHGTWPATNPTAETLGQSSTCTVMGILLDFGMPVDGSAVIDQYAILGVNQGSNDSNPASALSAANPLPAAINATMKDTYTVPYGLQIKSVKKLLMKNSTYGGIAAGTPVPVRYIAFIREVNSGDINMYAYDYNYEIATPAPSTSTIMAIDSDNSAGDPSNYRNTPVIICLRPSNGFSSQRGIITISGNGIGRRFGVSSISSTVGDSSTVSLAGTYGSVTSAGTTCE